MTNNIAKELNSLLNGSKRILITSHISPDGDSVSSSLLLNDILKLNFPDKKIVVSMEEEPFGLKFLKNYEQIQYRPLSEAINAFQPDLMFILDANALHRVTRMPEMLQGKLNNVKLVVIDHHEGTHIPDAQLSINNSSPAVTLDIYQIFLEQLSLGKPEGYAQTALTGIYTDTGGFVHQNFNFKLVFEVVPKLIKDGADIEKVANRLNTISQKGLKVLIELLSNTKFHDNYTYSFISDKTAIEQNYEAMVQAAEAFRTNFLRNIEGRPWGFIVYKDVMAPPGTYSVSLRSLNGEKDVSKIASGLGGGGHKPAAGAKIEVGSVQQAIDLVKQAISSVDN